MHNIFIFSENLLHLTRNYFSSQYRDVCGLSSPSKQSNKSKILDKLMIPFFFDPIVLAKSKNKKEGLSITPESEE